MLLGVKRSKVKVTGSIGPFSHTTTASRRHSLGDVASRRRGIELYECLLVFNLLHSLIHM